MAVSDTVIAVRRLIDGIIELVTIHKYVKEGRFLYLLSGDLCQFLLLQVSMQFSMSLICYFCLFEPHLLIFSSMFSICTWRLIIFCLLFLFIVVNILPTLALPTASLITRLHQGSGRMVVIFSSAWVELSQ